MSTQPTNSSHDLNIVILGESDVGKSSLTDRFVFNKHMVRYDPFGPAIPGAGSEFSSCRALDVDGELWNIYIEDLSTTPMRLREPGFRADVWEERLRKADGIVLLYDVTDEKSYESITEKGWIHVWECRRAEDANGVRYPTAGTKVDLVQGEKSKKREVRKSLAEEWASILGLKAFEVDAYDKERLEDMMRALVRRIKRARQRDAEDIEIVKKRSKPEKQDISVALET
ncbi:hypothetical protein N0V90_007824 [Kalmusia sp. IMI 367209]|nr:hypothetical protein N0V90_007824 [Kalmusia sp. IMI 367209]